MSASELSPGRAAAGTEAASVPAGERLRLLLTAALGSVVASYLLMVLVGALAGLTAGAGPSPRLLLVVAVPLWLAAHQVPLVVDGAPLSVLPLLPTTAVVALVASASARVTRRLGGRAGGDVAGVVAVLGGGHASVAVLATALPTGPVAAAPWGALLGGGLVAAVGAGLGILRANGLPRWWLGAPDWLRAGSAAAGVGAAALATEGALLLFAALTVAADAVRAQLSLAPGVGAGLGVTLLSVCYLPNALVAAVSWLAGPGLVIGTAAASPLGTVPGPLPPIPLAEAMPTAHPPGWAVVAFVLPALAGLLVGRSCRRVGPDPVHRVRAVGIAAVTVALGFGLLAWVVGGRLAGGPFDPVEVAPVAGAVTLLGWVGLPAVLAALLPERIRRARTVVPAGTGPSGVTGAPDVTDVTGDPGGGASTPGSGS